MWDFIQSQSERLQKNRNGAMSRMKRKLNATDISFRYGKEFVFDSFSHSFKPGISLIKGYSGCGKSTLLKLIAGYLVPQKGKITLPHPWGKPKQEISKGGAGLCFSAIEPSSPWPTFRVI